MTPFSFYRFSLCSTNFAALSNFTLKNLMKDVSHSVSVSFIIALERRVSHDFALVLNDKNRSPRGKRKRKRARGKQEKTHLFWLKIFICSCTRIIRNFVFLFLLAPALC
jgi:hypothetical protein